MAPLQAARARRRRGSAPSHRGAPAACGRSGQRSGATLGGEGVDSA